MDSDTPDGRHQPRPRVNPARTRWDIPPTGQQERSSPTSCDDFSIRTTRARTRAGPSAQASVTPDMLAQMLQFALQTTQQQTAQMSQLMAQTAQIQQQMLQAQSRPKPSRKKSDPPRFEGSDSDDLELWIFSTEQYYSEFRNEMNEPSSTFSDIAFANLGVDAQAWYRDVKISLGTSPLTWEVFKERVRARFRDKDFWFKTLTKMYELNPTKSQQKYTSRFLHLLSQVDTELPEVVKRWFFQQNLRADTSTYVSRNVPDTLEKAIELAQCFEDAKPAQTRPPHKEQTNPAVRTNNSGEKRANPNSNDNAKFCGYCKKKNHTEDVCRKKARDRAGSDSGSSKNGHAR